MEGIIEEEEIPTGNSRLTHIVTDVEMMSLVLLKTGKNDMQIFTGAGLKARLLQLKKKAIGEGGYSGHQEAISSPNTHDSCQVKLFKSRALKQHEGFNGMTKSFQIL
jgi:hypothetical protein